MAIITRSDTILKPLRADVPRAATPGIIIAAPRSGAGKTTVALGLMRALKVEGYRVQPFKCGPDYIDPAFHAAATGRPSYNLDTWAMSADLIGSLIADATADADFVIVEGVMGLFDGSPTQGRCGSGSTADLAALTGWPVVLVLDVSGQAETAAAVALGCRAYRTDIRIAGVILNRVASDRHLDLITPAFERLGMTVLGAVSRHGMLTLPERHLGLVQAGELADVDTILDGLAAAVSKAVPIERVIAVSGPRFDPRFSNQLASHGRIRPPGQRIALASDAAFSFSYPHMLQGWRTEGATIIPFSPLADEAPAPDSDAIWLPGGYPELHAARLAECAGFLAGLTNAASVGTPIHGECGGYMVLGTGLIDHEGQRHRMAGLLDLETSYATQRLHLGYRRAQLLQESALGPTGATIRGHEFHYCTVTSTGDTPLLALRDATGKQNAEHGSRRGSVSGTFFHAIAIDDISRA